MMKQYLWMGAVLLLALPLLLWLLAGDIPLDSDAPLHLHRIMSAATNLREGVYPRWTPYLHHGFGYPVHNYYSPAFYVVSAVITLLTPLTALATFKLMLMLALVLYPIGMYLFARRVTGRAGALFASALYLYAPLRLREVWVQMNLPQWWAMALLPFVLWAIHRALYEKRGRWWLVAGVLFALVVLTHHLTAFLFAPFAGLYALLLIALRWREDGRSALWASFWGSVGLFALGLGLSAIYWLPALGELDATQIDTIQDDAYSISANFVPFETLIAPTTAIDRSLLNWADITGTYGARVGQAQLAIALVALLMLPFLWRRWHITQRAHIIANIIVVGVLLYMMLPASATLWESLPLIGYIQFPWRLLGILLLASAMLGALLVDSLPIRWRKWASGVGVLVAFALIVPMLYAPNESAELPNNPTPADAIEYERQSGNLGLAASNEYLPLGVEERPLYGLFVRDITAPEPRIDRYGVDGWWLDVDENTAFPEGATLRAEDIQAGMRWHIDTPQDFTVIVHQMNFIGWQATLNDVPISITSTQPHGLISVDIPAGEHTLMLTYAGTSLQQGATLITLASLVLMGVFAWRSRPVDVGESMTTDERHIALPAFVMVGMVAYSIMQAIWLMPQTDFMRPASNPAQPPAPINTTLNFDDTLALVGYDMPTTVQAGDTIEMHLYWRALQIPDASYQSAIALTDSLGNVYASEGNYRIASLDTRTWTSEQYAIETYTLTLPDDVPPFHLQARLAVFSIDADGAQNSLAVDGDDNPIFATLVVQGDYVRWQDDALNPSDVMLQDGAGNVVHIRGWAWREGEGDVCLMVRWRAEREALGDYAVLLHWRDDAGTTLDVHDTAPFANAHPTQNWQVGQPLDDIYCIPQPDDATQLSLGMYGRADGVRLRALGDGAPLPEDVLNIAVP
jgi:hypothetical protein